MKARFGAFAALTLAAPILALGPRALAAPDDWAEGEAGYEDGASRDFYNRGGRLAWRNALVGDYVDASGAAQGAQPFATADVADNDQARFIEWDVTTLVNGWTASSGRNKGFFLKRTSSSGGPVDFSSKEAADTTRRPQLVIVAGGQTRTLSPEADTYIEPSTYQPQGQNERLRVGESFNMLLRFDLAAFANTTVTSATLRVHTAQQWGGASTIGVFACDQGEQNLQAQPRAGLAANYTDDVGIAANPDVLFFASFEDAAWADGWSGTSGHYAVIDSDAANQFANFQGRALRATLVQNDNYGASITYGFADKTGSEPEEIYFRYYLRLGDDWDQTVAGGKMPGFGGTYGVAGWGGRPSDGTNGWSARGTYRLTLPASNPLGAATPMGHYVYHADMAGQYGDVFTWTGNYGGYLLRNRWYCIDQYVKVNTPTQNDGVLRAWVDGKLAFEKTDLRFRDVTTLKVEQIWFNLYHGGTAVSPYDQSIYIDNVVVARQYIGPMGGTVTPPPDAGVPPADTGVPPADSAVTPPDTGAPPADSATTPTDSTVAPADGAGPAADANTQPGDGGATPPSDGGVKLDTASTGDGSTPGNLLEGGSGCDCRAAGDSTGPSALLLLLACMLLGRRRRRG